MAMIKGNKNVSNKIAICLKYNYINVFVSPVYDYTVLIPLDCVEIKWHTLVSSYQSYFSKTKCAVGNYI